MVLEFLSSIDSFEETEEAEACFVTGFLPFGDDLVEWKWLAGWERDPAKLTGLGASWVLDCTDGEGVGLGESFLLGGRELECETAELDRRAESTFDKDEPEPSSFTSATFDFRLLLLGSLSASSLSLQQEGVSSSLELQPSPFVPSADTMPCFGDTICSLQRASLTYCSSLVVRDLSEASGTEHFIVFPDTALLSPADASGC